MTDFKIFLKRRHICSTPGCRNKDTFRIAKTDGANKVLFLCEDCIKGACAYVQKITEKKED